MLYAAICSEIITSILDAIPTGPRPIRVNSTFYSIKFHNTFQQYGIDKVPLYSSIIKAISKIEKRALCIEVDRESIQELQFQNTFIHCFFSTDSGSMDSIPQLNFNNQGMFWSLQGPIFPKYTILEEKVQDQPISAEV